MSMGNISEGNAKGIAILAGVVVAVFVAYEIYTKMAAVAAPLGTGATDAATGTGKALSAVGTVVGGIGTMVQDAWNWDPLSFLDSPSASSTPKENSGSITTN